MVEDSINPKQVPPAAAPKSDPLFALGSIVSTPAALRLMLMNGFAPDELLDRHVSGDWADMDAEDQALNRQAIADGTRIFSAYRITEGKRVWLITEADRAATTFLLPHEY